MINEETVTEGVAVESIWLRRLAFAGRWGKILVEFALVQGLVQLLTAAAGLMIVRAMSKHDYALYAITNSMQVTGNLLADLGIGIGVRSIGGKIWNDRERFGQLLNTALHLRRRFALGSLTFAVPVAAWMLWRNGASPMLVLGLSLTIIAGVLPLLQLTVFNATLQLHAEYRRIQKLDLGSAAMRCGLIVGLALTKINALLGALVGVIGNWFQLSVARKWARQFANVSAGENAQDRQELIKLSWKWMPNLLFFCFQGQITLFILAVLGNPTGIADITALGRIAMLFAVFSVTFANVLAPRFTRCQEPARLKTLYLLLVGGTAVALLPFVALAWISPGTFLWLLGEKYFNLERECGFVVLAASLAQIATVMATLNLSRAWIRAQTIGYIPLVLCVQAIAAWWLDLRRFHDVVIFNLATAAAPIGLFALDAWLGASQHRTE